MLNTLIDSGALVYIDPLMFLPVFGVIEGDIDLPSTIMEYHIDWTSSEPDIIAIDGTVNRPSEEVGDVVVLLTATFVIEDVVYSIEYEVTVTHLTIITYTSVEDLHSDFLIGDTVIFHGIVSGIFNGGYFLTDGTHAIGVYNPGSSLVFEIGDEVVVQGEYVVYHTLYQIGNVVSETIMSTGNAVLLVPQVLTIAEILALDTSDKLIHGMTYTITGTVELRGSYDNVYLVDGDNAIMIYYYSLDSSISALEALVGSEVTITVCYFTNHSVSGPMVMFDGGSEDIIIS